LFTTNGTGIYSNELGGTPISDCEFNANIGDGIQDDYSYLFVDSCRFLDNGGAGVDTYASEVRIQNTWFVRNQGAGLLIDTSDGEHALVSACYFLGNRATKTAGAIDLNADFTFHALTLVNSVFVGNRGAASKGAVTITANSDGQVNADVTNCTFVRNSDGLSVPVYGDWFPPVVRVTNSVLWRSYGTDLVGTSATYSDIGTGVTAGSGNISGYPQFARYPSAGDDGIWGTADDDYGDLHLARSSPCFNSGSAGAAALAAIDADGYRRTVAGVPDMGAYEIQPITRSLFPSSIKAGSRGFSLIVNGDLFEPGAQVYWNGSPRATTFVSSRKLRVEILASDVQTAGWFAVDVVISGNDGSGLYQSFLVTK
jgi:hypothetical protein